MQRLNQSGFHMTAVILVIAFLGATTYTGFAIISKKDAVGTGNPDTQASQGGSPAQSAFADQYRDVCKDRDVTFTSGPMPSAQLSAIEPLGKVSDGHVTPTDHVYLHGPDMNAGANAYDAVMPADGTVVEVGAMPAQYIGDRNQQTAVEDHRLIISHSCRYFSIYIHVHKLDPAITQALGGALEPNKSKRISLELKAGDKLGKVGGNGFDWTSVDADKTLAGFITPELYKGEAWKIHTVSPFDMYTGDLRKELEAKSLRAVAPLGGRIDWDQPGKLVGNWFRSGSGGYSGNAGNGGGNGNNEGRYWDGHLSVAPDYLDGVTPIVSIGNWDGKAKQLAAKGSFDPAKVSASDGIVKVELTDLSYFQSNGARWSGGAPEKAMKVNNTGPAVGTIVFEVQSGEKLKVEKFVGKTAGQVGGFTSAAQTYER